MTTVNLKSVSAWRLCLLNVNIIMSEFLAINSYNLRVNHENPQLHENIHTAGGCEM